MTHIQRIKNVSKSDYEMFASKQMIRGSISSFGGDYYYQATVEFESEEDAVVYMLKRIPIQRRF